MTYQLSNEGRLALKNASFQKLSPLISKFLSEFSDVAGNARTDVSVSAQEHTDMLIKIGLLKQLTAHPANVTDPSQVNELTVNSIKKEFVDLVKKDLSHHDQFWDVLLNLELINNKDGLLWFMSQVTDISANPNQPAYKVLFEQLMALENE